MSPIADEAAARAWIGHEHGAATVKRLAEFVELLRVENQRQNLVSAASLDRVWVRHIADSAQLLHVPRGTLCGPWLDLGSGAGLPGLVIAMLRPELGVTMVENRAKRTEWLARMVAHFGLANARVLGSTLERVPTFAAGVISARAFAPLDRLIVPAARFSTPETQWLLPKGQNGRKELGAMPKSVQTMFHVKQSLTDADSVILVGRGSPSR